MEEFDRITVIETALRDMVLKIRNDTPTPKGYVYFNTVTVTNIDDEAIVEEYDQYPTISIYLDPDEEILSGQANSYENELNVKFVCSVSNETPIGIPKFEINKKMNTVISDLKAVISQDTTLGGVCDIINLIRSQRTYADDGDIMRAGDIEIYANVQYSQSRTRPDLSCF